MQQYKFRGKRKDNGEWAYGSYVSTPALPLADSKHLIFEFTGIESGEPIFDVHEVIPETVGMWTGLKDKNGKEVYEGDLYSTEESGPNYKVMFVAGAFVGGTSEHPDDCMPLGWDVNEDVIEPDLPNWFEVVGNIHDHPELLTPAKVAP
jgi:hypothetical protein